MNISSLSDINFDSLFQTPVITSDLVQESDSLLINSDEDGQVFSSILDSAARLINQTNAYSNAAEEEEIKYALGETDNIHDLQIAQQKANVSLQYTVAVRDAFMSGYKELMNMQF
ncbi:flagellar hook-basal body complex protein FliE [bacterium 1xD8-6]|nr:flagellar hook-basal body complex protein FliE [bacterium D16-36]RKI70239.1 flagellar hook-basal body complex protein FliE [bacterium 1xD8-6]